MNRILESTVVIVGVGLMGGSLGLALKARGLARRVIGVGRDPTRIEAACAAGILDEGATDLAAVAREADLVVCCTPVDRIATDVQLALTHGRPRLLVTDAGSTKQAICQAVSSGATPGGEFIGSHPLAGSHKQGFEFADANLFQDRVCVLTPLENSTASQVERLERFWAAVGMRTLRMTPAAHDRGLARTSHLPHVAACAVANMLPVELAELTATGFRDTTRIAAGDVNLWAAILLANGPEVVAAIAELEERLARYRQAIQEESRESLKMLLQQAKTTRESLG